ncbi:MAG: hypothetical protein FJW38_12725 [Acidobacteria bacterium]|nr:hypothetical protein [Acidobacteriota bacterium]
MQRKLVQFALIAALCIGAYFPFLDLPLISDDYLQIDLGRRYGPVSSWGALAEDGLYRCRATSIVLTHWTEQIIGIHSSALNLSSLGLHFLNCLLVFAAGCWRRIGYKLSFIAACIFAMYERPQEAVVWYAALPELLVFFFVVAALIAWIRFVSEGAWRWYALTWAAFLLVLLSKESAVVFGPLALAIGLFEKLPWRRLTLTIAPFGAASMIYYFAAQAQRDTHLHFNDGTFSLAAPFLLVIARSLGRLYWMWGIIAAGYLLYVNRRENWRWIAAATVWMAIALLPYSFLTYQDAVPSRHTYLASVGRVVLVALAFEALPKRRTAALAAAAFSMYQIGYLWFYKYPQYVERAEPTERLIAAAEKHRGPMKLDCFPYTREVAELTLRIRTAGAAWLEEEDAEGVLKVDGCTRNHRPSGSSSGSGSGSGAGSTGGGD